MAVSKRLKFEILRRDGFACRYCGAKAPDVVLTVDHVIPVALGGTDDPSNLVAACADCNGGKTSSTPDAPLVADVSDSAVRWAAAMKEAQARMLADIDARDADRAQFSAWWDAYGYSKPDDWACTVDQLTSAGLPMRVIRECIDLAAARRQVRWGDKFRYMCGAAWGKLADIRKTAQGITSGNGGEAEGDEDYGPGEREGRKGIACELLGMLSAGECDWYVNEAIADLGEDDPAVHETAAFQAAYQGFRASLVLRDLIHALPERGQWLAEANQVLYEKDGECFSTTAWYTVAAQIAARSLKPPTGEAALWRGATPASTRASGRMLTSSRSRPTRSECSCS